MNTCFKGNNSEFAVLSVHGGPTSQQDADILVPDTSTPSPDGVNE